MLLSKRSNRNIYIFSINKDIANLPPFLRPYECFGDYDSAVMHLSNGLKGNSTANDGRIGKREFLNAYWGLFGNTDIFDFMDKPMRDSFYNYQVYCLKSKFISDGRVDAYIDGLRQLIEEKQNPLASYLLSRHYRDIKYLDLELSDKLSKDAYGSFSQKVKNSDTDSEIGLWILTDDEEYDGAFYMCDIIHDVLDAYDVKTEIKILTPDMLDKISFEEQRKIVLFWSDVCIDVPEDFIDKLRLNRDKLLIGLNSFGENALSYDIRECELFENNNKDITKICRVLLS